MSLSTESVVCGQPSLNKNKWMRSQWSVLLCIFAERPCQEFLEMVSRIVCIMTIAGLASGAVWQGARLPVKPREHAHKAGCYIEEIDDVIPFGEIVTPLGRCYRIECTRFRIEYASCGLIDTDSSNCFITDTDVSRPYPHCCPDIKCEEDNYLI